jgi:heat-inducible transcriptional repressor
LVRKAACACCRSAPAAIGPQLSEARRGQIEESFTGVASSNEYLERTSHVLALISSGLGVALASSTAGAGAGAHSLFAAVAGPRAGGAGDAGRSGAGPRAELDRELTHLELETAARYLNENFRGWPIERIRAEVARRVEVEQRGLSPPDAASVEELCRKGALAGDEAGPAIFVEGWRT